MNREVTNILLWSLPLAALAAGAIFTFVGFRGRKIDNHPICRRCGYDLLGSSASLVCPECGGDLLAPKAIKLGHRQRSRRAIWLGIMMLMPALAVLGGLGFITVRGIDLDRHKPLWLLMREGNAQTLTELNRRLAAGELTNQQVDEVITRALAVQADRQRAWVAGWGNFIETAAGLKFAIDEQWKTYARQAASFKLESRPRMRRQDAVVLRVTPAIDRAGALSVLNVSWQVTAVRLADMPLVRLVPPGEFSEPTRMFDTEPRTDRYVPDASVNNLAEGAHPLHAELVVVVGNRVGVRQKLIYPMRLQTSVTIVPPGEPVVRAVPRPSFQPAIEQAIRPRAFVGVTADGAVSVSLGADEPPAPLAFDVVLRDRRPPNREWKFGSASFSSGVYTPWTKTTRVSGFDADEVDIILRSNEAVATRGSALTGEMWEGEAVLSNVSVAWAPGVKKPPTTNPTPTSGAASP
jgi:hypothetical protein